MLRVENGSFVAHRNGVVYTAVSSRGVWIVQSRWEHSPVPGAIRTYRSIDALSHVPAFKNMWSQLHAAAYHA